MISRDFRRLKILKYKFEEFYISTIQEFSDKGQVWKILEQGGKFFEYRLNFDQLSYLNKIDDEMIY